MKSAKLPEGYSISELPGGCRQNFPGGFREYQKFRGGYATTCQTDGRPVSHENLNKIFEGSVEFQQSKIWDDGFPFKLQSQVQDLEAKLDRSQTALKVVGTISLIALSILGLKLYLS